MRRRVPRGPVAGLLAGLLLSGCASLPVEGPVVAAGGEDAAPAAEGGLLSYDARPPQPGASPEEVVAGFLESMWEGGVQTSVAREFLTREAARTWRPEGTITYGTFGADERRGGVDVVLSDAARVDGRGRWRGPLSEEESRLRFPVVTEDGEWRIADVPNTLIVPEDFFEQRFLPATVHWFDPSGEILVPEPVIVPAGETLTTSLVRSLLSGPEAGLSDVVRSYLPTDLEVTSVPVSSGGLADIRLTGPTPPYPADQTRRLLAQVSATLAAVPEVSRYRIAVDDQAVTLNGAAEFSTGQFGEYDPNGLVSDRRLYGVGSEGLVTVDGEGVSRVAGVPAERAQGWRSVAVSPDGATVAGISQDGTTVTLTGTGVGDDEQRVVATGASDLVAATWDALGRLWLLDDAPGGALVLLVRPESPQGPRRVRVPGLSGTRARELLASRDGSRLVALVEGRRRDRVVVARIRRDGEGRVLGVNAARPIPIGEAPPERVRDLCWRSPTAIGALVVSPPDASQIRTVTLDGGPLAEQTSVSSVRGRLQWLACSPDPSLPVYAGDDSSALSLVEVGVQLSGDEVRWPSLTYPG